MKNLNKTQLIKRGRKLYFNALVCSNLVNVTRWNNIAAVLKKRYGITIYPSLKTKAL